MYDLQNQQSIAYEAIDPTDTQKEIDTGTFILILFAIIIFFTILFYLSKKFK